jgi:hypothetical protein
VAQRIELAIIRTVGDADVASEKQNARLALAIRAQLSPFFDP